jgi:putative ABC transport system permease protein
MLQNYLKLALRNLKKQRGFAAINILGLALGLTCCLLIALWVIDELSYDSFHTKSDRICRIDSDIKFGGIESHVVGAPAPLGIVLLKDYPQIESQCRLRSFGAIQVRLGQDLLAENDCVFADSTFFKLFSFPLMSGNPNTVLSQPKTVVISEKVAKKYFSNSNPIGQTLTFEKKDNIYQVSGIMQDMPENGHLKLDFLISMSTLLESQEDAWLSSNFHTYALFKEGMKMSDFTPELPKIVARYMGPQAEQMMHTSWQEILSSGTRFDFKIVPLKDIHLKTGGVTGNLRPCGNLELVWIFSVIALFILVLAVVNFMNLSTARSSMRAKEVGVRKALGSQKVQLVGQFLTESLLVSSIAFCISLVLAALLLPSFNQLANKEIAFDFLHRPWFLGILVVFSSLIGVLSGIYPAFVLSGFRPIKVLKGELTGGVGGKMLRSSLVTFQFTTSIILVVGVLVVYRQLDFIQHKNLGYNREQVLILNGTQSLGDKAKILRNEILQLPQVENSTITGFLPTGGNSNNNGFFKDKNMSVENAISLNDWKVDAGYIPTLDIKLSAGRNFREGAPADSNAIIINQSAAKMLGFDNPIDQELYTVTVSDMSKQQLSTWKIIGVIEDFNFENLRNSVEPMVLVQSDFPGNISFRLKKGDIQQTLSQIQGVWTKISPDIPFDYEFMDEQFNQMYHSESRTGLLALLASGIAIFIACLGLFALAAYTAERRKKEIGIRKVLGASIAGITGLLAKDFLKLVLIAIFIASPIAYYFMQQWLADFAYRIDIQAWMFVTAGFAAVLIAFLTVGFQSVKAALANPVKSLRSE